MFEIDKIIKNLKSAILPQENEIDEICDRLVEIFASEKNMLILDAPITVVGDIHGQFFDLLEIFRLFGDIPDKKYLFLGDIVDRGANSVESVVLLFALKVKYPNHIYIIRGNHESFILSSRYGFKIECSKKYDFLVYKNICNLFMLIPFCAVVEGKFFCIHGGLIEDFDLNIVEKYCRINDEMEIKGVLWSDPSNEVEFFGASPRGAGKLFGQKAVDAFITNRFYCLIRSHQLVNKGFEMPLKNVFTVWSAPNYCYLSGNDAAVCLITPDLKMSFKVFKAVENQRMDKDDENNVKI